MNIHEYGEEAIQTLSSPDITRHAIKDDQLCNGLHGAIGCCTESGELLDAYKRGAIYGKQLDRAHVKEELGDLMWYVNLVRHAEGLTWEEIFEANIAKLRARHGDKYNAEKVLDRDLDNERRAMAEGLAKDFTGNDPRTMAIAQLSPEAAAVHEYLQGDPAALRRYGFNHKWIRMDTDMCVDDHIVDELIKANLAEYDKNMSYEIVRGIKE